MTEQKRDKGPRDPILIGQVVTGWTAMIIIGAGSIAEGHLIMPLWGFLSLLAVMTLGSIWVAKGRTTRTPPSDP